MNRYGPKVYLGPNVTALGATYLTNDVGYKSPTGWRGALGAYLRYWQDFNGAGDRTIDILTVYPLGAGGTANFQALGVLASTLAVTAAAPTKTNSVATPTVSVVSGSPLVTRSSGSFVADGAIKGMGFTAASALTLGSSIISVDPTRLVLDRPATGTNAALAGRITNVPDVVRECIFPFISAVTGQITWPCDGLNFGFHGVGGTIDLTGLMIEAWPIFDGSELTPSAAMREVQGLA
jgi:hypothetical protein